MGYGVSLSYNVKVMILIVSLTILYKYLISNNQKIEYFFTDTFKKSHDWNSLTITDKLRIYGSSLNEKHANYADKLKVKKLIAQMNIPDLKIAKLIKIIDINDDNINLDQLPKNCIIKSNCGSKDVIIVKDRKISLMTSRMADRSSYKEWRDSASKKLIYQPEVEPHYLLIEPMIFAEEYLGDDMEDYKFWCFHGKVEFLVKRGASTYYDTDMKVLPFYRKGYGKENIRIPKPKNFKRMIEIAEEISELFEFCRMDLYNIDGKIYFGEITFIPMAANPWTPFQPIKYEKIIGSYWK